MKADITLQIEAGKLRKLLNPRTGYTPSEEQSAFALGAIAALEYAYGSPYSIISPAESLRRCLSKKCATACHADLLRAEMESRSPETTE